MKAITVRQPWAHAIIHFGKDIENRSWATNYRGRIAIHAATSMSKHEYYSASSFFRSVNSDLFVPESDLIKGAIIGTVMLVDCVTESRSPWFMGSHGFVLRDPVAVEPVPCKGMLGFWQVPDDIVSKLRVLA